MVRVARILAAGGLAVAAVVGHAGAGHAVEAVEAGWWTASPLVVAPDAPPDALVVEGGVAGEVSYGAVRYTLAPDEIPESLTVRLDAEAASTPNTTLSLCPLTETFTPAQGGPMADAPDYNCETAVKGTPSADGQTYEFDVTGLAADGALAVAILPSGPADRVVLSPPGTDSLATADAAVASPGANASAARQATVDDDVATPAAPATSRSAGAAPAPRPATPASAAAPSPAPAPAPAAAPPAAAGPSVAAVQAAQDRASSGGSWLPPAVFVGLVALAAALWLGRRAGDDVVSAEQPA